MLSPSFVLLVVALASSSSFTLTHAFTLPLNRLQGRTGAYFQGSPDADRARAALHKYSRYSTSTTIPATNLQFVQYTASIGVGSPPTYYDLVVDTGSSNTFVG